jgi:hypothetical protein
MALVKARGFFPGRVARHIPIPIPIPGRIYAGLVLVLVLDRGLGCRLRLHFLRRS